MTAPVVRLIDDLLSRPKVEWLERAGPIARGLNREATRDMAIAFGTVAGVPSGLSPCGSQAKPLIDYRKNHREPGCSNKAPGGNSDD